MLTFRTRLSSAVAVPHVRGAETGCLRRLAPARLSVIRKLGVARRAVVRASEGWPTRIRRVKLIAKARGSTGPALARRAGEVRAGRGACIHPGQRFEPHHAR